MGRVLNRAELARVSRLIKVDESGCWLWKGPTTPDGYGKHRRGPGHPERIVHRIVYEHYVGEVPENLQLDHLCRVRLCCNPEHLEPVTGSVNTTRQDHANRRKTHCPKGHEYTPENTRIDKHGKRHCRSC